MLVGVALAYSELPQESVAWHGLRSRVHERGGEAEVWFLLRDREPVLPVWRHGRLEVVRWGNRRGQSPQLPPTAWARLDTLRRGAWGDRETAEVLIPATLGLDRGVWFRLREGLRGVLVHDEQGQPVVYVLVEPSTHYYRVMTRSPWAPLMVGGQI
jgi:hypothetical protein